MTRDVTQLVQRLHEVLVQEIRARRPEYLHTPFTVAEIYQDLVPYGTHRDRIGASMNGDYEHALLRLLTGEGGYLTLESDAARRRLQAELQSPNPNTGVFREFAALDVRLNPAFVPGDVLARSGPQDSGPPADAGEAVSTPPASTNGHGAKPAGGEEPRNGTAKSEPRPAEVRTARPQAEPTAEGESVHPTACRWCREDLPQRASLRFCPFCGMDVNLVPCPSCGEELEPEWRFCIACGTHVAAD